MILLKALKRYFLNQQFTVISGLLQEHFRFKLEQFGLFCLRREILSKYRCLAPKFVVSHLYYYVFVRDINPDSFRSWICVTSWWLRDEMDLEDVVKNFAFASGMKWTFGQSNAAFWMICKIQQVHAQSSNNETSLEMAMARTRSCWLRGRLWSKHWRREQNSCLE